MEVSAKRLAVIAVVIGIVSGIALVWASQPQLTAVDCNPHYSGSTPFGSALGIGAIMGQAIGSGHRYNFTFGGFPAHFALSHLNFQVRSASGVIVVPGADWNLTVFNLSGAPVGTYSLIGLTAGTWTSGGAHPLSTEETFSLLATPGSLSGDVLYVLETGSLADGCPAGGAATENIP